MLIGQVSICAYLYEPDDQPAAYYPSKACWLFLTSVYTFGKTRDTFWHIHLMFYPIVKKLDATPYREVKSQKSKVKKLFLQLFFSCYY